MPSDTTDSLDSVELDGRTIRWDFAEFMAEQCPIDNGDFRRLRGNARRRGKTAIDALALYEAWRKQSREVVRLQVALRDEEAKLERHEKSHEQQAAADQKTIEELKDAEGRAAVDMGRALDVVAELSEGYDLQRGLGRLLEILEQAAVRARQASTSHTNMALRYSDGYWNPEEVPRRA